MVRVGGVIYQNNVFDVSIGEYPKILYNHPFFSLVAMLAVDSVGNELSLGVEVV